ncbi:PEP/pyruvate-binding domain-containing protein [Pilimelia columellifera]|uniref:Phosphoenolpyruvate synthase n=1 Tax=Pilimelia columellifera subsp. columellifera TaxID=706583 RepID=A0ABP6B188_9ACTN
MKDGPASDTPLVISLFEATADSHHVSGTKARNLALLREQGFDVPAGWCLTSAWFERAKTSTSLGVTIAQELAGIRTVPADTGRRLDRIRRMIVSTPLPDDLLGDLTAAVTPLLDDGPVIVRSSVPAEDGAEHSFAGVFRSEGPLTTASEVIEAVRRCWGAMYAPSCYYYTRGSLPQLYAAFIQRYITPDLHGVLFTHDPLGSTTGPVVDVAHGNSVDATEGRAPSNRLSIMDPDDAQRLGPDVAADLVTLARRAEELFHGPMDIEWAVQAGAVHALQARPVTSRRVLARPTASAWWIESAIDELYELDLGHCRERLERSLQKHMWLRRQCTLAGVASYQEFYAVYRLADVDRLAAELARQVASEFVQINWSRRGTDRVAVVADLAGELAAGHDRNRIADGQFSAVHIGEVVAAQASGFSALMSDGRILVEAFPAGLPGIKEGRLQPSVMVVDVDEAVHREHVATFDTRCRIFPGDGWWWRPEDAPLYPLDLPDPQVRDIARISRTMCAALGEARLEWYTSAGRAVIRDVSLESRRLPGQRSSAVNVISPGSATGVAVTLPDAGVLDDLVAAHDISVVGSDDPNLFDSDALDSIIRAMSVHERTIVVAEYPSAGLIPLVDRAEAFVFERGNLLCHTAIVLRERGIPAIVMPAAREWLRDGMTVEVSPAGAIVSGGSGFG